MNRQFAGAQVEKENVTEVAPEFLVLTSFKHHEVKVKLYTLCTGKVWVGPNTAQPSRRSGM